LSHPSKVQKCQKKEKKSSCRLKANGGKLTMGQVDVRTDTIRSADLGEMCTATHYEIRSHANGLNVNFAPAYLRAEIGLSFLSFDATISSRRRRPSEHVLLSRKILLIHSQSLITCPRPQAARCRVHHVNLPWFARTNYKRSELQPVHVVLFTDGFQSGRVNSINKDNYRLPKNRVRTPQRWEACL